MCFFRELLGFQILRWTIIWWRGWIRYENNPFRCKSGKFPEKVFQCSSCTGPQSYWHIYCLSREDIELSTDHPRFCRLCEDNPYLSDQQNNDSDTDYFENESEIKRVKVLNDKSTQPDLEPKSNLKIRIKLNQISSSSLDEDKKTSHETSSKNKTGARTNLSLSLWKTRKPMKFRQPKLLICS